MPRLTVRDFEPGDLEAAAALLAARQKRERVRIPALAAALESPGACLQLLDPLLRGSRKMGVVALAEGAIVGFLFGEKMTLAPTDFAAMFFAPHSISMPLHGHAVAESSDPTEVYRALYGELAGRWVRNGFFVHMTHITPADPAVQEAWVSLGFGRGNTCAVRDTSPVVGAEPAKVEIHQASGEDLGVIMALNDSLYAFHSESPIFWPFLEEPKAAEREYQRGILAHPANAHFVAYDGGEPVGMQTFMRPGFIPDGVEQDRNVYLYQGVVEKDARSGGIGTALLSHSMDWAREQGHDKCTLHFASANPSGAPFWLGHGFRPVEYAMIRHVDERVAWANGW
jgi:GNAT superfamily N-acetyltransferase